VFKVNWQYNTQKNALGLTPCGDVASNSTNTCSIDGDGFLFQVATYF
jgi:hypothetical protein